MSTVEGKDVVARYRFLIGEGLTNVNRMTDAVKRGANEQRSAMSRVPASIELVGAAFDAARAKNERFYSVLNKTSNMMMATGMAVAAGSITAAKNVANFAEQLQNLQSSTGLATDQLQVLKFVAENAGLSFETITNASAMVQQKLMGVEEDSGMAADAMKRLGISVKDTHGNLLPMSTLFPQLVTKLQGMQNATERNMLAAQIFGRSWREIAPVLGMSATEFAAAEKEARKMGLVLGGPALAAAGKLDERLDKLNNRIRAFWLQLGEAATPLVEMGTEAAAALDRVNPKVVMWSGLLVGAAGAGLRVFTTVTQLRGAMALLTVAKAADTLATSANTAATGANSMAMSIATGRAGALSLALRGVGIAGLSIGVGVLATGWMLNMAAGTSKLTDAANAEITALDTQQKKRERLIETLQRELELYRDIQQNMTASREKTEQLSGVKTAIQGHIREITDLLGMQGAAWDGTIEKLQEFIDKANGMPGVSTKQEQANAKLEYLQKQEEYAKAIAAAGLGITKPIRESAALRALHDRQAADPKLATSTPETVFKSMNTGRRGMEKLAGASFTETQWANLEKVREELRGAYLKMQNAGKPAEETPAAPGATAGPTAMQTDLSIATVEAAKNKERRLIDYNFAKEWGNNHLLAAAIGGRYAREMQQAEELARAKQDYARAENDATRKAGQEKEKLKTKDLAPDDRKAAEGIIETQMYDAIDAAAAALQQKKLSIELEVRKGSLEDFKEKMRNAYELTILGPRFKEMYKASTLMPQAPMTSLMAQPLKSLMPPAPGAPGGLPGLPSLPAPMTPASVAQAAIGSGKIILEVKDSESAIGKIKAIAAEGAVEAYGQAVGSVTR